MTTAQSRSASRSGSTVLRTSHKPSGRLPHPSWRGATGYAPVPRHPSASPRSASDFWARLGM